MAKANEVSVDATIQASGEGISSDDAQQNDSALDSFLAGAETAKETNGTDTAATTETSLDANSETAKPAGETPSKVDSGTQSVQTTPAQGVTPELPKVAEDPEFAGIQPPKNASQKELSNFARLRKLGESYKKQVAELTPKITQYEQNLKQMQDQLAQKQVDLPDDVKKKIEQAEYIQALYDVQNSPQFKAQFDDKIAANEEQIYDVLTAGGVSPKTIEVLKSAGGLMKFKMDGDQYGDDNGKRFLDSEYWNDKVLPNLSPSDRLLVESFVKDSRLLQINREKALKKAPEIQKQHFEEIRKHQTEYEQKHQAEVMSIISGMEKENPWASRLEILPTDSAEIKQQKEAQNKYRDEVIEPLFTEVFNSTSPQSPAAVRVQIAAQVVRSEFLGRVNSGLYERVQALEKQLEATKGKVDSVKAAQSMKPTTSSAPAAKAPAAKGGWADDLEGAMAAHGI